MDVLVSADLPGMTDGDENKDSADLARSSCNCGNRGRGCPRVGHSRNDPRAYAVDSGEITLDESLQRSGIQLPECVRDDLRYDLINDGFNYHYILYMKIETDEACASLFLGANKMQGLGGITKMGGASAEKPLSYRELWMSNKVISDMVWEIGPEQRFQKFGVTTHNTYPVNALVQHVPNSSTVRMYVYAFHGG